MLDEHDRKGERSDVIISWALTALSKLTIRLQNSMGKVKDIVGTYTDHANVEIQQRACEYLEIFKDQWDGERTGIFDPILFTGSENMLIDNAADRAVGQDEDEEDRSDPVQVATAQRAAPVSTPAPAAPTFDLDSILGGGAPA